MIIKLNTPILPLTDIIFFPHTSICLHLTEKRHIQMIHDCIENEQKIALTYIEDTFVENQQRKSHG